MLIVRFNQDIVSNTAKPLIFGENQPETGNDVLIASPARLDAKN
jgi:hypothetical protein